MADSSSLPQPPTGSTHLDPRFDWTPDADADINWLYEKLGNCRGFHRIVARLRAPSSPPPPATPSCPLLTVTEEQPPVLWRASCGTTWATRADMGRHEAKHLGAQSRPEAKHPAPPAEEAR